MPDESRFAFFFKCCNTRYVYVEDVLVVVREFDVVRQQDVDVVRACSRFQRSFEALPPSPPA